MQGHYFDFLILTQHSHIPLFHHSGTIDCGNPSGCPDLSWRIMFFKLE